MNSDYYILEDGEQKGPFTFDELIEMEPDLHTRVLSPNADGWQDACDLPELYDYFLSLGVNFPTEDNLASFWWRLLAYLIDYVILSYVLQFILTILASKGVTFHIPSYSDLSKLSLNDMLKTRFMADLLKIQLIANVTLVLYNSILEASGWKGSVGKKICKLIVVDADGMGLSYPNALVRSLGKVFSITIFYVGFLSIFWSEYRQALHDYLAKSYVIKL